MPKNKDSRLFGMKRCGPFKIKLQRRPPSDRASVELITPVSSANDAVQSSASSTIVLPLSSPPASISTSFFAVRTEPQQTEPLLTSTPDTSFALPFYSPSVLPSPIPSPIYSVPAPLNQLQAVKFLPGPPTPSPPRPTTPSPQAAFNAQTSLYCDMRFLRGQLRPIRPAPMTPPLFAAPPRLVIPQPRGATVVRLPSVPVSRAGMRGYTPMSSASGGLDLRVNRPYPDFQVFSTKLRKVLNRISPSLVFYESQGETLFSNPSIREFYKTNLSEVRDEIESVNNLL